MNKAKPRPRANGRLDATAWTDAALKALARSGIDGVRVELLARELAVTKGSFYAHFKDRDALYESMLSRWRRQATLALIERLDRTNDSPELRLRQLYKVPMGGERAVKAADVELAIRLWGRRDLRAKAALEEVDSLRLRYIAGLLVASGIPEDEAQARAVLGYCYMRVAASIVAPGGPDLFDRCEDLLIAK